jgi:chromate transporter
MEPNPTSPQSSLADLAKLFLKLGIIGFGGPAAHIAMMQREVVAKRHWMTDQHFLDLVGATNLIPGPNSTEMAIHIGHERAGIKGLIVAGLCFILPAVCITGLLAWLYGMYGQLPSLKPYIYGIQPAIIAIVLGAVYPLAKKSLKSVALGVLGIAALVFCFLGVNQILVMFGVGAIGLLSALAQRPTATIFSALNGKLFLSFLKIGAILYGSGYVLFAFLDEELVTQGLLTRQQLIDAIAVGQFTPGPVFSSVTFIGYQINGWSGALVSTIGIFLPSFVLVALLNPLVPKMRQSKLFSAFLDAVNVASIAVIAFVCYQMAQQAITDWRTVAIALASLVVAFIFKKVNSAFIVLGGSGLGYLLYLL